MEQECIELTEQIERCRRLAQELTDDEMRQALEALAQTYEAKLKRPRAGSFMLRDGS
jgi:hypothetical protein